MRWKVHVLGGKVAREYDPTCENIILIAARAGREKFVVCHNFSLILHNTVLSRFKIFASIVFFWSYGFRYCWCCHFVQFSYYLSDCDDARKSCVEERLAGRLFQSSYGPVSFTFLSHRLHFQFLSIRKCEETKKTLSLCCMILYSHYV